MFITFEGLDFSGKTTQAKLLIERLAVSGRVVHFLREPGGTAISERIRDILLDKKYLEMGDTAELLLFSASRTQLVAEVIAPALKRGETIVCDRYYDSTTAYQSYGRGLNLVDVRLINKVATNGIVPDMTFLVDIPVEEIERRKAKAGLAFDRMESSGKEFYWRVRNGYLEIARAEQQRFTILDGMLPVEEIHRTIWESVEKRVSIEQLSR